MVPIPGSRNPAHIVENAAAAHVRLGPDVLAAVDAAVGAFEPVGRVS